MAAQKYIMTVMTLGFITLAAHLGVSIFYKTLTSRMDVVEPTAVTTRRAARLTPEAPRPLSTYQAIAKRNLFKTGDEARTSDKSDATPPPQPVEDIAPTTLKLKLWGTVTGDGNRSYAVIEDPRKRMQNLYREGDTIQDNAVVKKILREQVILTVAGKDEMLSMEKVESGQQVARAAGISAAQKPRQSPRTTPFAAGSASAGGGESQRYELKREQIEEAVSNVNQLMRQAKIRPHFRDGKPDGLTLSRIRPNSIFEQLGLKSGDIITGVDGENIESVDDALRFYNSLKSSSNVKIQIRRRGQEQNIEYNIE